jgi:hypothetical protein
MYWSPSTNGFYHSVVHDGKLPPDAVPISHERHAELLDAINIKLHVIKQQSDGSLTTEPAPPTADALLSRLRGQLSTVEALGIAFVPASAGAAVMFSLTPDGLARISNAAMGAAVPRSLRASNGTPVALTAEEVRALHQKADAFVAACDARYAELHAAIVGGDLTIDVTGGWPKPA